MWLWTALSRLPRISVARMKDPETSACNYRHGPRTLGVGHDGVGLAGTVALTRGRAVAPALSNCPVSFVASTT